METPRAKETPPVKGMEELHAMEKVHAVPSKGLDISQGLEPTGANANKILFETSVQNPTRAEEQLVEISQDSSEAETLRVENARLREELAKLQGGSFRGKAPLYATMLNGAPLSKSPARLMFCEPKVVNGKKRAVIPRAVIEVGKAEWEATMVGFYINGRPPIPVVIREAWAKWKDKGLKKVLANDSGFFFFKFEERAFMYDALEEEIVQLGGNTIVLKLWTEGQTYRTKDREEVPRWCKLSNIPHEFWNYEGISRIASLIGKPICMDSQSRSLERVSYARVCIMVAKGKQIESEVEVEAEGREAIYKISVESQKWYRPLPEGPLQKQQKQVWKPKTREQPVGCAEGGIKGRSESAPGDGGSGSTMGEDRQCEPVDREGGVLVISNRQVSQEKQHDNSPNEDAGGWQTVPRSRGPPLA